MGNIVLLDDLTINKIAAGEVIERPASVVKEMVENSIDAGATVINIEIKNGGISYIRISDNGKGISKDDMEIAFERHATSKIRSASDLEVVKSMGFRGEALASIAAISHVEMVSRTEDEPTGNKIVVEAGDVKAFDEIACPKGTTITVTNLFFNTPVRYKFLKKDFTEAGYIEDAVERIALVNPNIAIKLINTGKTVIQTTGNGKLQDVIYGIYGKDIASSVLDVDYTYEEMKITGVVGKPEIARSNRSNQIFFVNKRYIKDKMLSGATEKAFKGLIPIGKFGFVILNIDMEPSKVDVNVHPAKLEVRFEEENKVFKAIFHAIQDTLLKSELISSPEKEIEDKKEVVEEVKQNSILGNLFRRNPAVVPTAGQENSNIEKRNIIEEMYNARKNKLVGGAPLGDPLPKSNLENVGEDAPVRPTDVIGKNTDNISSEPDTSIGSILTDLQKMKVELEADKENINRSDVEFTDLDNTQTQKYDNISNKINELDNLNIPESFETMYEKTFGEIAPSKKEKIQEEQKEFDAYDIIKEEDNISVFEEQEKYNEGENIQKSKPEYKFIGIVFRTYIIIEIKNEMYMIDQHAAHEKVLYEKIKRNYYSNSEKECQMLLLPDVITLTPKEMDVARDNIEIFKKAGFELEEFGENTIRLNGVPPMCYDINTKDLFLEVLDEINTVARTARQEIEERFIATVACKSAVKAHMKLTEEEVENLINQLLVLENPFTCPHGRPTTIKMDLSDIEKKFARRK